VAGPQDRHARPTQSAAPRSADSPEAAQHRLRILAVDSVQLCLEVTAGRRPPQTLAGRITGDVAQWLRANAGATATPGRVHRLALHRIVDQVDITALIRAPDRSVSALTMQLRVVDQRWRITTVDHLQRGQHVTHPEPINNHRRAWRIQRGVEGSAPADATGMPAPPGPAGSAPFTFDLAILHGAAAADQHRASIATDAVTRAAYAARAGYWLDHADRITSYTATLRRPDPDQPAANVTALLGRRPSSGTARSIWDQAATAIDTYRRTWHITEQTLPLGTPRAPSHDASGQQLHRRRTIARVNALLREMDATSQVNRRDNHGLDLSP
jgi:hypothetical protein